MSTQIRDGALSKASLYFRNKEASSKSVSYTFKSFYGSNCLQLRKETELLLEEEIVAETSATNWNSCGSKPKLLLYETFSGANPESSKCREVQ
jgi:hypothetical protein